jgi:hypothetical protein
MMMMMMMMMMLSGGRTVCEIPLQRDVVVPDGGEFVRSRRDGLNVIEFVRTSPSRKDVSEIGVRTPDGMRQSPLVLGTAIRLSQRLGTARAEP